jgi:hypothetical protein
MKTAVSVAVLLLMSVSAAESQQASPYDGRPNISVNGKAMVFELKDERVRK